MLISGAAGGALERMSMDTGDSHARRPIQGQQAATGASTELMPASTSASLVDTKEAPPPEGGAASYGAGGAGATAGTGAWAGSGASGWVPGQG